MSPPTKERKKSFSSFNFKEACKYLQITYLQITELSRWTIESIPVPISGFFQQRLERLQVSDLEIF